MQSKTKLYANSKPGNSHTDNLMPCFLCGNEGDRITDKEKELLKAIGNTKSKSTYARSIRQVCEEVERTGNVDMFRELINTINDMVEDNHRLAKNILGEDGIEALRKVSTYTRPVSLSKPVISS